MQSIINTLKDYFDSFIKFFEDFADSIKDFVTDLPATLLEYASDFIMMFLDWAGSYCSYCLGGVTLSGSGSAASQFGQKIQAAYNALSPCILYALNQADIAGCLQIMVCATTIWSAFKIVGLVRSIA